LSEDWANKIADIKEETEKEVLIIRSTEDELRKKYAPQQKEILDMIETLLTPIVEKFKDPKLSSNNQPKVERKNDFVISLIMPIIHENRHESSGISFCLKFTDKGYSLEVNNGNTTSHILAPIEIGRVQQKVLEYLENRKNAILSKEKKSITSRRD